MPTNKIGGLERGQGLARLAAQEDGYATAAVEQGLGVDATPRSPGQYNAEGDGPEKRTKGQNKGSGG